MNRIWLCRLQTYIWFDLILTMTSFIQLYKSDQRWVFKFSKIFHSDWDPRSKRVRPSVVRSTLVPNCDHDRHHRACCLHRFGGIGEQWALDSGSSAIGTGDHIHIHAGRLRISACDHHHHANVLSPQTPLIFGCLRTWPLTASRIPSQCSLVDVGLIWWG